VVKYEEVGIDHVSGVEDFCIKRDRQESISYHQESVSCQERCALSRQGSCISRGTRAGEDARSAVKVDLGYFVLHAIDRGWPQTTTLREVRVLFPEDEQRVSGGLERYVRVMYEVFIKGL
jgi:hypothetical protein